MRNCSKCGLPKDESEFSWSVKGVKRHSACNECRAKDQADYYQRTKPQQLKYKYERQAAKREEARHYVFTYLSTHPCVDCGEVDPYVLTFDLVTGTKKMNISQMVNQGYSLSVIQSKIEKCVFLNRQVSADQKVCGNRQEWGMKVGECCKKGSVQRLKMRPLT